MKDKDKTKEQLANELEDVRQRVAVLEKSEVKHEQAEKVLPLPAEDYQRLFEIFPIGVTVVDMKGVILYCNSAVYNKGGYTEDEFIGKHFSKIAPLRVKDIPKLISVFSSIVGGKIPQPFETIYQRKDGTTGWTELSISLMKVGGKRRILVLQHDITERRQTAKALRESEERLRFHVENSPMAIVEWDSSFIVTRWAGEASKIFGWSADEIIGKPIMDLHMIYTEDIPIVERVMVQLTDGVTPYVISNNRNYTKSGGVIDCTWYNSVLTDANGKMKSVMSQVLDITERKQAGESLRLQAEIMVHMAEGVYLVGIDDAVIYYTNPKFEGMFGYEPGEMIGKHVSIVNAPTEKHPEETAKEIMGIIRKTGEWHGEVNNIKKDGTLFWCYANVSVFKHPEYGEVLVAIHTDITERKQAEERENQLQQELSVTSRLATVGEMASGIAHEINNPLTGVVGFSDLLLQKDLPEDMRKDVNTIHEGAKRIASIVNRMLTFARQHKPERTSVNINDIVENTLAMRAYEMESSSIKVTTEFSTDIPLTFADAGQLQQVFLNIVLNAEMEMNLAHGKGNLLVKTKRIDNTIQVSFKDDGPGIPKKNLDRLFDPFFTTRDPDKGTGLGLSICYSIVTQHSGKIYARSRLGKGATFFVELPVVTKEEQLKLAEPSAEEPETVSKARILIVDDDTIVQQFLTEVLGKEGHEVEIVENGDDALERVDSEDYDVILLDIKLPGMSGIELYKYMQKAVKSLARRVVFITGDTMNKDTMDFLAKTGASYITKPFDAEQLKSEINHILNQQA